MRTLLLTILICLAPVGTALGAPESVCDGCKLSDQKGSDPAPLIVVLHGDDGSTNQIYGAWKSAAEERGVVLFAPKCPTKEKCFTSWWQWNGPPSWLQERVGEVKKVRSIDPERIYLAGWSGGTSYLGMHSEEWFPFFAAIYLGGGGVPSEGACYPLAGGACAAARYLSGDLNPLFHLAEQTRDRLRECGHEVDWHLLPGTDHSGEWRAYQADTGPALDWLLNHRASCIAKTDSLPVMMSSAPSVQPPVVTRPPAIAPRLLSIPPAKASCTCSLVEGTDRDMNWSSLLLTAVVLGMRRAAFEARPHPRSRAGSPPKRGAPRSRGRGPSLPQSLR